MTKLVLAIESSCDDTAVSLIGGNRTIHCHLKQTQIQEHAAYGGVVPELAARAHLAYLPQLVKAVFQQSGIKPENIDAIAATAGPGLIGGLLVGVSYAKGMAVALDKPFIAVNHLAGHALTVRMIEEVAFPYMLLLTSGGHCQLMIVHNADNYELLGQTLDDAAGEAFDKLAKILDIPFDGSGGAAVEKLAKQGDATKIDFAIPLKGRNDFAFSFSGLKAAAKRLYDQQPDINKADLCAAYQQTIARHLTTVCNRALQQFRPKRFVVAGGVAANQTIRQQLESSALKHYAMFHCPPMQWCTDNAAMIGWAAIEQLNNGAVCQLGFNPSPRWLLYDKVS